MLQALHRAALDAPFGIVCCKHCTGLHSMPNGAWKCLARYVAELPEFVEPAAVAEVVN